MHEKHRAKLFRRRCLGLGIDGVSLHSYRYAWAERAKVCGYPERFAQEALGHNSKAVHRAYARKAKVKLPSLEVYERRSREAQVIPMPLPNVAPSVGAASSATVEHGHHIYLVMVWASPFLIAWILRGGFWRKRQRRPVLVAPVLLFPIASPPSQLVPPPPPASIEANPQSRECSGNDIQSFSA